MLTTMTTAIEEGLSPAMGRSRHPLAVCLAMLGGTATHYLNVGKGAALPSRELEEIAEGFGLVLGARELLVLSPPSKRTLTGVALTHKPGRYLLRGTLLGGGIGGGDWWGALSSVPRERGAAGLILREVHVGDGAMVYPCPLVEFKRLGRAEVREVWEVWRSTPTTLRLAAEERESWKA